MSQSLSPLRSFRKCRPAVLGFLLLLVLSVGTAPASAAFVNFQNCLSESYKTQAPLSLQFVPLYVNAVFNTSNSNYNLNVTVWGNVTGSGPNPLVNLPPGNNTDYWNNPSNTQGKIQDVPDPSAEKPYLTTLFNKVNVLTYEPFNEAVDFCDQIVNGSCPLGPSFTANKSDPYDFPSFSMSHNFFSSYEFTSFTATQLIRNGDAKSTLIGCISTIITPDLGGSLSNVLRFLPFVILVMVAIATAFAAVYSPWGTTDVFRWTSNYGRDDDLLRLVTPGFGDCLQYIQFVVLTGSLSISYPGFYQPIISKASWSVLMFNQSFVSHGPGAQSLVDGIYVTNGIYGLDILRQLVGMSQMDDIWAGMAVWLMVILAAVITLIQLGFVSRWAYRQINNTSQEDLRAKNMPFSMGNVIRIVFSYFLLPIVALSMFQLVIAGKSPAFTVALAALMLLLIILFTGWLLYFIAATRPRQFLFDDLPTVLLYGSLYNTYSDNAAPFALVPVLLTFVRGVAIGAVQPSGIAQLVLLAICEVITILTLHAFRPFHSPTSMNMYHTIVAAVRFTSMLLMISFVPSLGVSEGPKGWIGYAILLMHAIVLIFGFFLNALQTIVEVAARLAGAGGDEGGATRGGLVKVFGMRQLSRRLPRVDAGSRQSQLSTVGILDSERDQKGYTSNGRGRSQSAGSTGVLLNRQSAVMDNSGIDPFGAIPSHVVGSGGSSHTPTTPGDASTFSFIPSTAAPSRIGRSRVLALGLSTKDAADPYYRPPRMRRPTIEAYSPGARSRGSWASGDWTNRRWSQHESGNADAIEPLDGVPGRGTPVPQLDPMVNELRRSKADYSTREVDFYYGVRGPALNANVPNRRIKTGPSDPTGIPASAVGWFKSLFNGKTKEKGKGFEVVRSHRMPPGMNLGNGPGQETPPEGIPVAAVGGVRRGTIDSDSEDETIRPGNRRKGNTEEATAHENENLVNAEGSEDGEEEYEDIHVSDLPPSLPGIEPGEDIELPSRFPSKASSRPAREAQLVDAPPVPQVPRKSSKRQSQALDLMPTITNSSSRDQLQADQHSQRSNPSPAFSNFSTSERPTGMGYVHQHNIQTVDPGENPQFLGTSAEVVNDSRSSVSSFDHQQH
ncbi:hypothetical protein F5884DRAFT_667560 [Xylogone sp. PMI_703]|nr:hypothetical protein F5884DRAFT_667560 [Xylogone sp. PMI_703]